MFVLLEIDFLPFNVRMSKCSACGALLIDCLLQREKFAWRKCTGLANWQPFPLFHPLPFASPCSCSTFLLSDIQSFHFVNLTQWAWARGRGDVHQHSEEFSLYISPLLEKQRMFCWGLFFKSASVIPIRLPSVPAYGSPRAKPQEMRYWYDPREVRKGHLFHRCRWQNSRRKPRGQGKYERGRAHEEMRYETSKKAGARFVCGLLIVQSKAHTASQTAVFSKNTFSDGSCCEKEVDSSDSLILWIYMEGIRNWSALRRCGWGALVLASNSSAPNFHSETLKIGPPSVQLWHVLCSRTLAEVHSLTGRQRAGRDVRWETGRASTIAYYDSVWFCECT